MSITFHTESTPEHLELNVANRNGYLILRELLDQGSDLDCYGELDTSAVLRSLALSDSRIRNLLCPTTDNGGESVVLSAEGVSVERVCRVIDVGVTEEQVEYYVERLLDLAHYARAQGEPILYG